MKPPLSGSATTLLQTHAKTGTMSVDSYCARRVHVRNRGNALVTTVLSAPERDGALDWSPACGWRRQPTRTVQIERALIKVWQQGRLRRARRASTGERQPPDCPVEVYEPSGARVEHVARCVRCPEAFCATVRPGGVPQLRYRGKHTRVRPQSHCPLIDVNVHNAPLASSELQRSELRGRDVPASVINTVTCQRGMESPPGRCNLFRAQNRDHQDPVAPKRLDVVACKHWRRRADKCVRVAVGITRKLDQAQEQHCYT